jgi:hypothetical protein
MYAFGDWMLNIFIGCMLLVPTFLLAFVTRNREDLYLAYSKFLVGFSLTLPSSVGLFFIPAVSQGTSILGKICLQRTSASPVVIVGLVLSRFLGRLRRVKRLTSYALLIEFLTLVVILALLLLPMGSRRG